MLSIPFKVRRHSHLLFVFLLQTAFVTFSRFASITLFTTQNNGVNLRLLAIVAAAAEIPEAEGFDMSTKEINYHHTGNLTCCNCAGEQTWILSVSWCGRKIIYIYIKKPTKNKRRESESVVWCDCPLSFCDNHCTFTWAMINPLLYFMYLGVSFKARGGIWETCTDVSYRLNRFKSA